MAGTDGALSAPRRGECVSPWSVAMDRPLILTPVAELDSGLPGIAEAMPRLDAIGAAVRQAGLVAAALHACALAGARLDESPRRAPRPQEGEA